MSRRAILSTIVFGALTIGACATRAPILGSTGDASMTQADINTNIDTQYRVTCAYAMAHGDQDGERLCQNITIEELCQNAKYHDLDICKDGRTETPGQIIHDVCAQGNGSLPDALQSLMQGPEADKVAHAGGADDFKQALEQDFRDAMYACLNGQVLRNDATVHAIQSNPENQRIAADAREQMWHRMMRGVARSVIRGVTGFRAGRGIVTLRRLLLAGVCEEATRVVTDFLSPEHARPQTSSCDFSWTPDRLGRCAATAGSVCTSMAGFVNLGDYLKSEDDVVNYVEDALSVGIETLCRGGGAVASVACGTINSAIGQIVEAVQTGDNSWAECLGVSQAATCLGEWWGSGGWTDNSGVSMDRRVQDATGQTWTVRDCCECEREIHVKSGYWPFESDSMTSSENWMGVIQAGDFDSGNCAHKMDDEYVDDLNASWTDYTRNYHKYTNCHQVTVVGDTCSLQVSRNNGPLQDESRQLWDADNNRPGDTYISR